MTQFMPFCSLPLCHDSDNLKCMYYICVWAAKINIYVIHYSIMILCTYLHNIVRNACTYIIIILYSQHKLNEPHM